MNDPTCPMRENPRHTCADKFGDAWDRPGSGPRPGTRCHVAAAGPFTSEKEMNMAALGALLASTIRSEFDDDDCENAR